MFMESIDEGIRVFPTYFSASLKEKRQKKRNCSKKKRNFAGRKNKELKKQQRQGRDYVKTMWVHKTEKTAVRTLNAAPTS